jgi:hypothetical protein
MRSIKLVLVAVGAVVALSAFSVSTAAALPLFVSKSGTYPQTGTISGGLAQLNTASGHEVDCQTTLGNFSLGLRLSLFLILFHKCKTTLLFSTTECNSPGEPAGLIHIHIHTWLGYLTNASGEKMVGLLAQPENNENVAALFECNANSLEHAHVLVLGEAVGGIAASEINKLQRSIKVQFGQSATGVQTPLTFLLPTPLSLMTNVKLTSDITGSISETTGSSEVALGTALLAGTEEGEIQG